MNISTPKQGSLLPCHNGTVLKGASSLVAFLFLFSFFFFPSSVFSIEVGGHIRTDTTWSPENNPYVVIHDIYVDPNVTLTIEPGTVIEVKSALFDADYSGRFIWINGEAIAKMFWVDGKIVAEGTAQDSIIFTRHEDNDYHRWGTIYFSENNEDLSIFKHCQFKYSAKIIPYMGWHIEGTLVSDNGKIWVEKCYFQDVYTGVTFCVSPVEIALIEDNIFMEVEGYPDPGLYTWYILTEVYSPPINLPLIAGNIFSGGNDGIRGESGAAAQIVDNKFEDIFWAINYDDPKGETYIYNNVCHNVWGDYVFYFDECEQDTLFIRKNRIIESDPFGIEVDDSNVDVSENYSNGSYIGIHNPSPGNITNNFVTNGLCEDYSIGSGGYNFVFNNKVTNGEGGYGISSRTISFQNNIAISNEDAFLNLDDPTIMENNIIYGNDWICEHLVGDQAAKFRNNVLDFQLPEGCEDLGGNLWQDPMFVAPDSGDFHLLPNSPAIDAGFDTLASYYPVFDMDFNQRIWNGDDDDTTRIDIGVYEYGSDYLGGISGHVFKYEGDDEPLPYVLLKINNINSKHEFADSAGFYHFNIKPGTYDIYATRLFYDEVIIEDVEVTAGETTIVDFAMEEDPTYAEELHPGTESLPKNIILYNYPNPFNPNTTIAFQVPNLTGFGNLLGLKLEIYDISGNLVKTLLDKRIEPGYRTIIWNGRDENNTPVASGVYLYQLKTNNQVLQTNKMLLLK
jgi:hypothetical protein